MLEQNEVSVSWLLHTVKEVWVKLALISLAISIAIFFALHLITPSYVSESRVLIAPVASYQNPAAGKDISEASNIDQATVLSQIQVIQSRDIMAAVIKDYALLDDKKLQDQIAAGYDSFLNKILPFNLTTPYKDLAPEIREQITIDVISKNMQVVTLSNSRVLGIRYHTSDPVRAAAIANSVAGAYIKWQRSEKVLQTQDDSIRLARLINDLKKEVKKSEAAVAGYRAQKGIYKSDRDDVTLSRQQLTELNSRIIAAREARAESEIRAKLIAEMLKRDGEILNAPDAMRSPLINRLFEQKTQLERSMSELGATLLPSHPRLKQLRSELASLKLQIRSEMARMVEAIENDAKIARARESALVQSLNDLKNLSNRTDGDEIQLRALEREANTNRDLLNTYLARYRDAEARKESAIAPSYATIVSKAHVPIQPYFPKIVPLTLIAFVISFILGLGWILVTEVIKLMHEDPYNDYEAGGHHQDIEEPQQETPHHRQSFGSDFRLFPNDV